MGPAGMAEATSRLERALVDAGHPLHRHLQPGLPAAEVDAFMRPTGIPVHHQYSWPDYSDHGTATRVLSVTLLVHTWAQMLEVGHWRLWQPGDLCDPRDGTAPYPLNITRPQWGAPAIPPEERDPDLDLEWLLGVPP